MAAPTLPLPGNTVIEEDLHFSKVTFWRACAGISSPSPDWSCSSLMVLAAVFAKQLAPFDPNCDRQRPLARHAAAALLSRRSQCGGHPLGTDEVGRDLLSRLLFGARSRSTVGLFAVLMEVLIGSDAGSDRRLLRRLDRLGADARDRRFPLDPDAAALAGSHGNRRGELDESGAELRCHRHHHRRAFVDDGRAFRARLVPQPARARVRRSRAGGRQQRRRGSSSVICCRTPLLRSSFRRRSTSPTSSSLESTLSFLGLGIQPPTASWGNMLANAQSNLSIAWWAAVFPGLCILVTALAINYIGDGLRDALDPNMV